MDYPADPGETAWITARRKPLHPLCSVSPRIPFVRRSPVRSRRLPAARSVAHRRSQSPLHARHAAVEALPDLHASRRKGSAPVLPSHLHRDSDRIRAHVQEVEILITPN